MAQLCKQEIKFSFSLSKVYLYLKFKALFNLILVEPKINSSSVRNMKVVFEFYHLGLERRS